MEKMPYRDDRERRPRRDRGERRQVVTATGSSGLPVLAARRCAARAARVGCAVAVRDADDRGSVAVHLAAADTVEGFERFIAWTHAQRAAGTYACFAVTLKGFDTAIGIFQVRS